MMVNEKIGFDYILKNLDIASSFGNDEIKKIKFQTSKDKIEKELLALEKIIKIINEDETFYFQIKKRLKNLKDIRNTLQRLKNGYIMDDVELFEIKIYAMYSQEIYEIVSKKKIDLFRYELKEIIYLLDPDNLKIQSFYIYDSYSIVLSNLRKQIKKNKTKELLELECLYENEIREKLSKKIMENIGILEENLEKIAYLDLLLAKAKQAIELNLTRPKFSSSTDLKEIFNPKIKSILDKKNKKYQKIDLKLEKGVTIITGANMSGKTVILKTLGLIQKMAQMGFFIPAKGTLTLVTDICISIGDFQSVEEGLSSFASEILEIDKIIKKVKNGEKPLVLIDELARTTNPKEGKALLQGVIDILEKEKIFSLITTHYDGIGENIKKLQVKGLKKEIIEKEIDIFNLDSYIDYSLVEIIESKVPEEALTIARLLNVDKEIIKNASKYLECRQ